MRCGSTAPCPRGTRATAILGRTVADITKNGGEVHLEEPAQLSALAMASSRRVLAFTTIVCWTLIGSPLRN